MNIHKNQDLQWEGFQHFVDHQQKNVVNNSIIKQSPILRKKSKKQTQSPLKNRTLVIKNKKNKTVITSPQKLSEGIKISDKQQLKDQPQKQPQKQTQKTKVFRKKYERIPIVKFQDYIRKHSSIVYRGFVPRSSDNYFRLIKQVNFQTSFTQDPLTIRKKIPDLIQFNSKFEGGNLNLATRDI